MRNANRWLIVALVVTSSIGAAAVLHSVSASRLSAEERELGDHWRFHDGRWSMWHAADRRWYYTDGKHWFVHDGAAWQLYHFDAKFGRTAFVHAGYKPPHAEVKVVLPRHEIFIR